ncbi:hypothetical protein MJO28_015644 [Puccinia striiformis f. sp. tritici]|uniref:Uncharacterized protein n=1 Tax=Puccinia striiformis f. sp. tritici TaxID=168172 RepID=A0ACC0DPA1_9BASI|nr:hypothetical protein MJO28_015644 [Puccinia striiformis f. sp. tritici]
MAELVPIKSVGGIVQSFQSATLDRESEQKYPDRKPHVSIKEFFESELSQLFVEYDTFFHNSNLSNQSTHILSTVKENEDLERLTTISLEKIDAISQWLRKSMVRLVEEEWSKLVEMIDEEIEWLLKDIYTNYDDQEEEDSWDDEAFIPDQRKDLFRAAIPVMRLSRI